MTSVLLAATSGLTANWIWDGGEDVLVQHEFIDLDNDTHVAGRELQGTIRALREDARGLARVIGQRLDEPNGQATISKELEEFGNRTICEPRKPACRVNLGYMQPKFAVSEVDEAMPPEDFRAAMFLAPLTVRLSRLSPSNLQLHADVPVYRPGARRAAGVLRLTLDLADKFTELTLDPRSIAFVADENNQILIASSDLRTAAGGRPRSLSDIDGLSPARKEEKSHLDIPNPEGQPTTLQAAEKQFNDAGYHSIYKDDIGLCVMAFDIDAPRKQSSTARAMYMRMLKGLLDKFEKRQSLQVTETYLTELQSFLNKFNDQFKKETRKQLIMPSTLADNYPDYYPYVYVRADQEDEAWLEKLRTAIENDPKLSEHAHFREISPCDEFDVRFVKLFINPDDPSRFLTYGYGVPEREIRGDFRNEADPKRILWVILVVGLVAAYGLSRFLTRPLEKMQLAANSLAKGRYDITLPVNAGGEIGSLARAFEDMVQQIRARNQDLRSSAARTQAILDMAAEGIITISVDGKIESFNQAAERILGYPDEEIIGKDIDVLLDTAGYSEQSAILARLATLGEGKSAPVIGQNHELTGRRKDGSTFPMEMAVGVVDLGTRMLFTAIVRDITERKKAERVLRDSEKRQRRLNEELDRRVTERTAELVHAKAELERSNQELSAARDATEAAMKAQAKFFDEVAHDLRTPLTNVIGYSEDLLARATEGGQEDFVTDLKLVVTQGEFLGDLINDLLNVSKAMSGNQLGLNLTEFNITAMLRTRLPGINHLVAQNDNRLVCDFPDELGTMVADEVRVWRILMNLLTNACKFTQEGILRVSARRESGPGGEHVIFEVSDTGIGMTADQVARLFNRFEQVHARSAEMGFGLGLSICALYCRAMGGEIRVASEQGKGSTFTVRLPVIVKPSDNTPTPARPAPPEPSPAPPPVHETPRNPERQLVLIIDDDSSACELLRRNLADQGFETRIANSGEEGIALARQILPAAILLDVVMPGINGWAVLAALKTDETTARIPIIMVTMMDDQARGFALGADEFVTKPLGRDRLAELLRKHLGHAGSDRVLVVEDDSDARERLVRMLKGQGFVVASAADGREAFDCIAAKRPDLILLDLLLPRMDGFEVVDRIRKDPDLKEIPIIVITGTEVNGETRERLEGRVSQIFQKGRYGRDELFREVRTVVAELHRRPEALLEKADA